MKLMGSSSKVNQVKKKEISDHTLTVRNRLHQALSLGIRYMDNKRRWQCIDGETQLHALRAMSSFVNCTPSLKHSSMKETISDMLLALEGILRSESDKILILAVDVTLKLITCFGSSGRSMYNYNTSDVAISLSLLLRSKKIHIATSCAVSLNRILKIQDTKEGWEIMIKNHMIDGVICALQDFVHGVQPTDYFIEMASLLKTILHRWSSLRYPVWSNAKLMDKLLDMCSNDDISPSLIVLQVLSVLALCGNGAKKILESEKSLSIVVHCLGKSNPDKIRTEALKLCQHFMRSENGSLLVSNRHCGSIVKGIIYAMGECKSSSSSKLLTDQMSLVLEACRAASITKWAGKHHSYFWHLQIDKILLDVLIGNFSKNCEEISLSDKLIAKLNDNITNTRPYIWDILGWLATHCEEDFLLETKRNCLDALIFCSCAVAVGLMHRRQCFNSIDDIESEPVCRAVMMLILSPSEYISSKAKSFFAEIAEPFKDDVLQKIMANLKLISLGKASLVVDGVRSAINLIGLTCFSTLTQFHSLIIKGKSLKVVSSVIAECLSGDIHVSRSGVASHLYDTSDDKTCCFTHVEEWEGKDILLFYSLQALSQLIQFSNLDEFKSNSDADSLIKNLKSILSGNSSSGPKLYAAHALSFFGFFGIQNSLQKNMLSFIDESELTDFEFVLSNGQSLRVHGAIIFARCPNLLPSKKNYEHEIELDSPKSRRRVKLSDRVEYGYLMKIMEYIYTGFFVVNDDHHLKPLKVLAHCCQLKTLFHMLLGKLPRWGSDSTSRDFTRALDLSSNSFFDIILEANANEEDWDCRICKLSIPHFHAHKIILSANCDYLRAMFNSGMHESRSKSIKVSVCWDALSKLIKYFYSGKFPTIQTDCIWKNMNVNQQLQELKPYVELSSLAEQWLLEDIKNNILNVIFACLDFDQKASAQLIPYAIKLGQWEIVEHAVNSIAHLYPKMRGNGDLEEFDEVVVDMLRTEYVRFCQKEM